MKKSIVLSNGLTFQQMGFVMWLIKTYGYEVTQTHEEIAAQAGCLSDGSVRLYLIALEHEGYIRIERKGKHGRKYILDMGKVNELMVNGKQ